MACNGIEINRNLSLKLLIFILFSENSHSLYSFIVVVEEILLHSELFYAKICNVKETSMIFH